MRSKCFREKRMLSIKCNNFCSNFSKGGGGGRPGMTDGQAAGGATACLYSQFFHISRHSEPGSQVTREKTTVYSGSVSITSRRDSLAPPVSSLRLSKTRDLTLLRFSEPARLREGRDERWRQPRQRRPPANI